MSALLWALTLLLCGLSLVHARWPLAASTVLGFLAACLAVFGASAVVAVAVVKREMPPPAALWAAALALCALCLHAGRD